MNALHTLLAIEKERPRWVLLRLLGLGMLVALLELAGVGLVFPLIAVANNPAAVTRLPLLSHVDAAVGLTPATALALVVALLVPAFLAKCALQALYYGQQARLSAAWQEDLANRLLSGYLHASYQAHIERHSAELIRNVANLVRGAYGQCLNAVVGLGADLLAATALVALLLLLAPLPSLIAGTLMTILLVLQQAGFQWTFRRLGEESAGLCHEELLSLQQSLGAIREGQVLGRQAFFAREFADIQRRLAANARKFEFARKLPPVFTEAAMVTVLLAAIMTLLAWNDRSLLLAQLGLLAAAAFRLMPLMNRITMAINTIQHARGGLDLLWGELTQVPPAVAVSSTPERLAFHHSIELRQVGYSFSRSVRPTLSDISLTVRRGEFIGLIGESGAGKSTLADIILGVLVPTTGKIAVDDRIIEGYGRTARLDVGYVPQRITIFDDTLRRNVAFAVAAEAIDDARVEAALEKAQLMGLVRSLPSGLDTTLGEHGQRLSGGQRQRIGIARALYHTPDVLVLDEATSALDLRTEEYVNAAIVALRGEVTLIVIAHRLSTVRHCDRLIFLDDGRLADAGTFAKLSASNVKFRRLVELAELEHDPEKRAPVFGKDHAPTIG